jgi:hypothetical protein
MNPIEKIKTDQTSLSHIFRFHRLMEEKNIMLVYCGEFSQDLNKILLSFIERKFKAENIEDSIRRRIFNIMVEVLQNVSKNKIDNPGSANDVSPIFMLGSTEKDFLMISSNIIKNGNIETLKNRLDQVNSLDKEGLKTLYRETRLNSSFTSSSGAGIGLIDIARKSENKIEYSFEEINSDYSIFSLLIRITKQ